MRHAGRQTAVLTSAACVVAVKRGATFYIDAMADVALWVSLGSLGVAVASAAYTWQSADSSKKQVHDARTPVWESIYDSSTSSVCLRLLSSHTLVSVSGTITEGRGVRFAAADTTTTSASTARQGPVRINDPIRWRIELADSYGLMLHLRLHCIGDAEKPWDVAATVKLPNKPFFAWGT